MAEGAVCCELLSVFSLITRENTGNISIYSINFTKPVFVTGTKRGIEFKFPKSMIREIIYKNSVTAQRNRDLICPLKLRPQPIDTK